MRITITAKPGTGRVYLAKQIKEMLLRESRFLSEKVEIFDTTEDEEVPENFNGIAIVVEDKLQSQAY